MVALKLFTLGGLSIMRGDQPVGGFVSRKVDALLVYLAHERREHQREALATLFWDDLSQERALGNLRTALSNLSMQLDEYLLITRQTVMIRPDVDCWIDSLSLIDTVKSTVGNMTAACSRDLTAAVDLYKGDFLTGFHLRNAENFEKWRLVEAERLQGYVLSALQRLVRYALDRNQYEMGINHARQMLSIDPYNEEAHRNLILLLARSGQRGAAIAQYETCVQLLRDELGVEPEQETIDLLSRIQLEQMRADDERKATVHLPIPSTPFINRPKELGQITERLRQDDCRLLTIIGSGGMGKTRLALQAAADVASDFRDGVCFVAFNSVQQGKFIPVEIATALGFTPQGIQDPLAELIAYLAEREVLLVLDNFEHLVDDADQLSAILSRAPKVRILVTSRVWLNRVEEWGVTIEGMSYPNTNEANAADYEAVRLFASCARRVDANFSLEKELDSVVTICRLVEGMPLSIELAAAWLRVIPTNEIANHINLKFLTTKERGVSKHHRSAEAVFDTSWRMLTPDEADAMSKLSVFKGAFDREAAQTIAHASLPILASLVEKSLIRRVNSAHYSIHELLRQYAFEQLTQRDGADNARNAHLTYYVNLTSNPDSRIHGEQQTAWLERLESEHDNLSTAISWALEKNTPEARDLGLKLAASIWEFWLMRGHITEGRQWLELLLDATQGTISEARGAATQGAGYLAWIQGESDRAEALHREGLAIREAIGDKAGMGGSLSNLGVIAWSRGDFASARELYERALAVRHEANYPIGVASVLSNLSLLMQEQSLYAEAIAYAEQAWHIFEEIDDTQGMAHVLYNMGAMYSDRGELERARELHEKALKLARQLGDQRIEGGLLFNLGIMMIDKGETDKARKLLDESLALMTRIGDKQHIALIKRGMATLALIENRLDDALALIDASLAYLRQPKGDVYLGQALITRAKILNARGDFSASLATFREGLTILIAMQKPHPITEALDALGAVLRQYDAPERASVLFNAASAIRQKFDIQPSRPQQGLENGNEWMNQASLPDILRHIQSVIDDGKIL